MGFFAFLGFIVWVVLMVLIFKKAGYSGLQMILLFIPLVNVMVFIWFALTEWPIEKELKNLKSKLTGMS
jgi:bacteriorhodopsin